VKCEQYWPQSLTTESSYDDITVYYVSYEEWADYMVRVFEVTKVNCDSGFSHQYAANSEFFKLTFKNFAMLAIKLQLTFSFEIKD